MATEQLTDRKYGIFKMWAPCSRRSTKKSRPVGRNSGTTPPSFDPSGEDQGQHHANGPGDGKRPAECNPKQGARRHSLISLRLWETTSAAPCKPRGRQHHLKQMEVFRLAQQTSFGWCLPVNQKETNQSVQPPMAAIEP